MCTARQGAVFAEIAGPSARPHVERLIAAIEAEDPDTATVLGWQRFAERAPRRAQEQGPWLVLAWNGPRPVGLALVSLLPKIDRRAGWLLVDELYVLRHARRCGAATALLERALRHAETLGVAGVRLLARPGNHNAQSLYEHMGYRPHPCILYEKPLGDRPDRT